MTRATARAAALALVLAGCATLDKPPATLEARKPPAGMTQAESESAPRPAAVDQTRVAEQLNRIAAELGELQNAVAKLIASSRLQDDQLAYLRRRVEELEAQNRGRQAPVPSGFAPLAPGTAPTPPPAALASATTTPAADLYRAGVQKLQAKGLDAAILTFYDLIVTYPDDPLREGAQFLVADIFYNQRDFRGALAEFEALIAAVPRGEKVADALLKIGLCQKNLGDAPRAKRTWARVVKDYPASLAARQARALLRS